MHKYYYKDDNQYFVLDDTNKLYRYTCKNNIEFILNYENALEILEQDLHTDGISKIMAYDELPYKMLQKNIGPFICQIRHFLKNF